MKTKLCKGCKIKKEVSFFNIVPINGDGFHTYCKYCRKLYNREYRIKNIDKAKNYANEYREQNKNKYQLYDKTAYKKRKDKKRDTFLKFKFNISLDDYNKMLKEQNNKCKICEQLEQQNRVLCVDHCHKTGKVRGLLCNHCNAAIGMFKDNINSLSNAIKYLEISTIEKKEGS